MALTNWGGTDADFFAPFFGGGFPSGALTTQRGGGDRLRGIPLDVIEKPNEFEIDADIPGVDKKDIKLAVDGDVLTISVQKAESKEVCDLSKVQAKYENGTLKIEVPKAEQKERSREVKVE